jgi:hypothetical protein
MKLLELPSIYLCLAILSLVPFSSFFNVNFIVYAKYTSDDGKHESANNDNNINSKDKNNGSSGTSSASHQGDKKEEPQGRQQENPAKPSPDDGKTINGSDNKVRTLSSLYQNPRFVPQQEQAQAFSLQQQQANDKGSAANQPSHHSNIIKSKTSFNSNNNNNKNNDNLENSLFSDESSGKLMITVYRSNNNNNIIHSDNEQQLGTKSHTYNRMGLPSSSLSYASSSTAQSSSSTLSFTVFVSTSTGTSLTLLAPTNKTTPAYTAIPYLYFKSNHTYFLLLPDNSSYTVTKINDRNDHGSVISGLIMSSDCKGIIKSGEIKICRITR